MNKSFILATLLIAGGAYADTQNPPPARSQKQSKQAADSSKIPLPQDARLVATEQLGEVRTFPELNKNKEAEAQNPEALELSARDNVYESNQSYRQVVQYFDNLVKNGKTEQQVRMTTKTSTAWELKLPSGQIQNVIVRNTQPTTIETVQAKLGEFQPGQRQPAGTSKNYGTSPRQQGSGGAQPQRQQ